MRSSPPPSIRAASMSSARHRDLGVGPHQVDADRADHARQHHAPDRVDQVRLGVGEVERNGQRGDRDQQPGDDHVEDHPRAAEPEPGQAVAGERGQRRRPDAAEDGVQRRVAEPLDVGPVAVHVLEQQRERVEEVERPGEPEAERLEDVRLRLGRVDEDPRDRDEREDREQEGQPRQQRDGAAAQAVELDRDRLLAFLEAGLPAPLASGRSRCGRGRGSTVRLPSPQPEDERDRRDGDDDQREDDGHGGGEVGLVGGDRGVVDVDRRGVIERHGALLEVAEDLRLGEQLQRADRVEEDQHDDGRPDHRQLDPQDDLPQRRVVEDRRLDHVARHRFERGVQDHHVVAGPLPDHDHDDRWAAAATARRSSCRRTRARRPAG